MKLSKPNKPIKTNTNSEALNDKQKDIAERKLIKILVFMTMAISAMNYMKTSDLEKNEKIVLIPYGAKSGDMFIQGESASTSYVRQLARLIVSDFGTFSKANIDSKSAEILGFTFVDRVEAMRQKLNKKNEDFKRFTTVSQVMELAEDQPMEITENPKERDYKTSAQVVYRFNFTVEEQKIVGEKANSPVVKKMYFDYTVSQGRFWLLDIQG